MAEDAVVVEALYSGTDFSVVNGARVAFSLGVPGGYVTAATHQQFKSPADWIPYAACEIRGVDYSTCGGLLALWVGCLDIISLFELYCTGRGLAPSALGLIVRLSSGAYATQEW